MTIGESIRHHRKRLGLTQLDLAKRLGVSVQAISKWETNTGLPDIAMTVPLARALGTTTDDLLQFGHRRNAQEQVWMEALQRSRDDPEQMLAVALAALKEFPWDWQFLYRAAVAQIRIADNLQDLQAHRDTLCHAAVHAQLALEMDPDSQCSRWVCDEIRRRLEQSTSICN